MNALTSAVEFLPTDGSSGTPPWIIYVLFAIALISTAIAIFSDSKSLCSSCLVVLSAVVMVMVAAFINDQTVRLENKANLVSNIRTVYDLDEVILEKDTLSLIRDKNEAVVEVRKDDLYGQAVLTQDPETYEPKLTPSASSETMDKWLEKK